MKDWFDKFGMGGASSWRSYSYTAVAVIYFLQIELYLYVPWPLPAYLGCFVTYSKIFDLARLEMLQDILQTCTMQLDWFCL